jgi:hypothetical protein
MPCQSEFATITNQVRSLRAEIHMSKTEQFIGEIDRDTRIYKILKREFFFELFENKKNALVLPKIWQDPFENVILNSEVRTARGETGRFSFHEDVYGQCWTLHRASDAMWQIYSEKKNAVRVRTTVGKLIDSLCAADGNWADATCFIGEVDYLSETKLKAFGRKIFKDGVTPTAIARSLLVKRNAYEHEREVRLIYIERRNKKHAKGVYKYDIDPHALFDQAMIDPRVPYVKYVPFKEQVMKRTGLSDNQIMRSLLYRQPEGFVVEIP